MDIFKTILAELASYVAAGIGLVLLYYVRKAAPAVIEWLDKKLEGTKFELEDVEKERFERFFDKLVLRVEERSLAAVEKELNMDLNQDGKIGEPDDEMAATPSRMETNRQARKLEEALAAARTRFPDMTEEDLRDHIEDAVARLPGLGATGRAGIHDPRVSSRPT